MVATRTITIDDFERMGSDADEYELIDGVPRERGIMGGLHGRIGFGVGYHLGLHVLPNNLGRLYTSDTGFVVFEEPLTVLRPDVAFVREERIRPGMEDRGYMPIVPDLVVEVVSPNDRYIEVAEKVERYRRAGVPLIWVIQPSPRAVIVYAAGSEPRTIGEDGDLDGGDVLPGFRLPVGDIFR